MKRPNLDKILDLLQSNQEFSLTESQYLKSTGATLPKQTYYLKNNSALSKIAKEYGFIIEVKERTICLKRKVN